MKCPYCAEEIQDAAVLCRFCGHKVKEDQYAIFMHVSPGSKNRPAFINALVKHGIEQSQAERISRQNGVTVCTAVDQESANRICQELAATGAKVSVHEASNGSITSAARKHTRRPMLFTILIIAFVFGTLYVLNEPWKPRPDTVSDFDAEYICREFVERQLKSPSTAKFGQASSISHTGNTYLVKAYVDAQNSFGATIRTDYSCRVTYQGSDQWHLDNLETSP